MIKIYIADIMPLVSKDLFEKALALVDEERRKKALRFRFPEDRARSVACGLLLKKVIPKDVLDEGFVYGEHGKPYLAAGGAPFISLSHSGDYAVLAVADTEVGVDIQEIKPFKDSISKLVLSEAEHEIMRKLKEEEAELYFLKCFSAKESILKMTGEGITTDLRSIEAGQEGVRIHRAPEGYVLTSCVRTF